MFKGRGASDSQVLGIFAFEGLLLGIVGFAGGISSGANWPGMGNTLSSCFRPRQSLP